MLPYNHTKKDREGPLALSLSSIPESFMMLVDCSTPSFTPWAAPCHGTLSRAASNDGTFTWEINVRAGCTPLAPSVPEVAAWMFIQPARVSPTRHHSLYRS